MTLLVEQATAEDIPAWLELAEEVGDLFGVDMAHDPSFRDWLGRSIERGAAYCVWIDGKLAGAMQYRKSQINWLAVSKRFRRCGVGRTLVAYALAFGDEEVRVTTFGPNHPHPDADGAHKLYSVMGFVLTDDFDELASDGTPRIVMVYR